MSSFETNTPINKSIQNFDVLLNQMTKQGVSQHQEYLLNEIDITRNAEILSTDINQNEIPNSFVESQLDTHYKIFSC